MTTTASTQVLYQVLEPLRGSVAPQDASILAFQLLAWAQLSAQESLGPKQRIGAVLDKGVGAAVDALTRLSAKDGLIGQAFSGAPGVARHADTQLVTAGKNATALVDAGVFERFQVADIVSDLVPWLPRHQLLSPQLVGLVSRLAITKDIESVYCPWDANGQFAGAALRANPTHVYVESLLAAQIPALISMFYSEGRIEAEVTDPLRTPGAVKSGRLVQFAATIACPPMGVRVEAGIAERDLYARFPVPKATATGLMIQHIAAQTRGRAAIVVPNSFLFGFGSDRDVREHLLKSKCIHAVVALPGGLLSNTNIPVGILVLDTNKQCNAVKFVDATQEYFQKPLSKGQTQLVNDADIVAFCWPELAPSLASTDTRLAEDLAVTITTDELLANDAQLQVNRYVMSVQRQRFEERWEAQATVELDSLAIVIPSLANKDRKPKTSDGTLVLEVGAADLPPVGYIQSPTKKLQISPGKTGRSRDISDVFLRPYDIVLITKGSAGKVGIVPRDVPSPGPGGWIAGQSAVVLRANAPDRDLRALALLARSDRGQELLATISSGSTIRMISIRALKGLETPVLSEEFAARAVQVLDHQVELQQQIDSLKQQQSAQVEALLDELFPELPT